MRFCWFAQTSATVSGPDLATIAEIVADVPGATDALLFTPGTTRDPYLDDDHPPALAIQVYFNEIEALESALAEGGPLTRLVPVPSLSHAIMAQQAMLVRHFPTPDPVFRTVAGSHPCTYLVAYEGTAEDLPAWLSHYLAHHAAIMTRFPGIRRVEVCSRIDWCGALPWPRADHMQRNKVVFDSADALTAALNSPVRHEMRADFSKFPPFSGPVSHFPMTTRRVKSGFSTREPGRAAYPSG